MPVYDIHVEVASGAQDMDDEVWRLVAAFERSVAKVGIQLNFTSLKKDKQTYPRSRKEYDAKLAWEAKERKREAAQRVKDAEERLREAMEFQKKVEGER